MFDVLHNFGLMGPVPGKEGGTEIQPKYKNSVEVMICAISRVLCNVFGRIVVLYGVCLNEASHTVKREEDFTRRSIPGTRQDGEYLESVAQ